MNQTKNKGGCQSGRKVAPHDSKSDLPLKVDINFLGLTDEQKDHVQKCLKSRRVLEEDEILRLSKQVGSEWRQFGNALKFNFTKLDALAAETESQSDAVYKMVLDWMAWKKEKATVGRLTKALYLNTEWEAILSLNP